MTTALEKARERVRKLEQREREREQRKNAAWGAALLRCVERDERGEKIRDLVAHYLTARDRKLLGIEPPPEAASNSGGTSGPDTGGATAASSASVSHVDKYHDSSEGH